MIGERFFISYPPYTDVLTGFRGPATAGRYKVDTNKIRTQTNP